ncbi:MAG: amino acid permease [Blautia sp.]
MSKTNADGSKSLGRGDLLAIAIGNVIGGGVMTMTGLAIGITGRSIILSYIICAIMVTIVALPQFFLSGTIRMNGGFYTQAAMFGGKWFAGLYSVVFVSYFFGATMYSASFADYVLSAFPEIDGKWVAFGILTVFVLLNLVGIQVAAKVQYALVIILVIALILFAGFGFIHLVQRIINNCYIKPMPLPLH